LEKASLTRSLRSLEITEGAEKSIEHQYQVFLDARSTHPKSQGEEKDLEPLLGSSLCSLCALATAGSECETLFSLLTTLP